MSVSNIETTIASAVRHVRPAPPPGVWDEDDTPPTVVDADPEPSPVKPKPRPKHNPSARKVPTLRDDHRRTAPFAR